MALRVFKNKDFRKFTKAEDVSDEALWEAVDEVEDGQVDARLGGFLIKKRVARPGEGKRGGYRTIMAHRQGDRLFLLYGFAKNERSNITDKEETYLKKLGDVYMKLTDEEIEVALQKKQLWELKGR